VLATRYKTCREQRRHVCSSTVSYNSGSTMNDMNPSYIKIKTGNKNNQSKMGKQRTQTALVVYRAPVNKKKSSSKKKKAPGTTGFSGRLSTSSLSEDQQYALALRDPFSDLARGVRMIDRFCFPTSTRVLRSKVNMLGNASALGSCCFMPNPFVTVFDSCRQDGSGIFVGTGTSMNTLTNNSSVSGLCTPAQLAGFLDSFRVVAGGVKLRVQMPEGTRTGTIIIAPVAMVADVPGWNALNNSIMTKNDTAPNSLMGGVSQDAANSNAILNMPGAREYSLNDMAFFDIELPFRPITAFSERFRDTDVAASFNSTQLYGTGEVVNLSTGVTNSTDNPPTVASDGWNGWLVYLDGHGIINTSTVVVSAEIILHIEGIESPQINNSISESSKPISSVNTLLYNRILDGVSKLPWENLVSAGLSNFGYQGAARAVSGIGRIARGSNDSASSPQRLMISY